MTIKVYYLGLFFIILILLQSCSTAKTTAVGVRDIQGYLVIEKVDSANVYYKKEDNTEIIAHLGGIEFNGGKEALKAYIDSAYYNNPHYNYNEFNILERFHILFAKDLSIEEVRILYRESDSKFYYESILIDALKNTTGRWHKTTKEDKEWYTYLHSQKIY